ncbi:Aldo/keto reductase [Mycena alexandri]|uniref:Aldo/keto reductase n=1 Tax=Mycena alexandri TaxID=1745969 RepID=A0AAD6T192_9AGAR|nr:Aldo/keto reductase [Mycena alexandri]
MSSFFETPTPPTKLGHYRVLSPLAGIHVSPIQLGAMSIGDKWGDAGMGAMDKESSFKLLDAYFDNGGNFIDTANIYQDGTSEMFIGEWAEKRDIRDQLVITTKYTNNTMRGNNAIAQRALYVGNNIKSMHSSVGASLKRLRTTYIDILYLHWWDWSTGIEEVMNGLHNIVVQGKVLYLGISDTPAWVVAQANQYARDHGKNTACLRRTLVILITSFSGLALAPFGVLAYGNIRSDAEEQKRKETGELGRTLFKPQWEHTEDQKNMVQALEKVAEEVGAKSMHAVAIAYVMQKVPYCFPIIGGRKIENMLSNIEALDISLSEAQIAYLESIVPFDPGFPHTMIGDGTAYSSLTSSAGVFVKHPRPEPIRPSKN